MNTTLQARSIAPVETTELITFRLNGLLFGIEILHVKEINCHLRHTPTPFSAGDVCGVINLRGEVLTVIDLGRLLRLNSVVPEGQPRYVIVASEKERIALLVDSIEDVMTFDRAEIASAPANFHCVPKEAICGIYSLPTDLLIVLDVDGALSLNEEAVAS